MPRTDAAIQSRVKRNRGDTATEEEDMVTEEVDMATVVDTDTEAGMGVVDTDTEEATEAEATGMEVAMEAEATGTEAAMGVEDMGTEVATDMARSNNESCPLNCSINLRIMFPKIHR